MSELLLKQFAFSRGIAKLLNFAFSHGIEVTLGEFYRPPETAALYAKQNRGLKESLHIDRLAADLMLFQDGKWLTNREPYEVLAKEWKSYSSTGIEFCWGGDFENQDCVHYSIAYQGRK